MRKKLKILPLALVCALMLCGCSQSSRLENHSYALVMGVDRCEDGGIRLKVILPKITGGSDPSASGGDSNYTKIEVRAKSYEEALEKLDWAAPRDLNLSHLKLVVLSEKIAREERCDELIENIAQTERLFTSAWVSVCAGDAADFVDQIKPAIGTRISSDIDAQFEHYTNRGYLPAASLADLYYQTESVYSDPMVAYALLNESAGGENGDEAVPASVFSAPIDAVSADYESGFTTRYLGAAVFSGGRMCGTFNGAQTILASMIRNELESFRYAFEGQSLLMVPARACFVKLRTNSQPVEIEIDAHLAIASQEEIPDEGRLKRALREDIVRTVRAAQQMGAEPFGFAQKAAKSFLTFEDWLEYDWISRFSAANIDVKLHFSHSDA